MKSHSLTARLSLLFALCAATVLLGVGWVMVQLVEHHFVEMDKYEIAGKLALVRNLLAKTQTAEDLAILPRQLNDALVGHQGLTVTILAPNGSTYFTTAGERHILVALLESTDSNGGQLLTWQQGKQSFRKLVANAVTGLAQAKPYIVTILLDISHHRRFVANLQRTLALAIALASLATAFLGWVVTWTGLRPLRRLTALAISLNASQLGARLPQAAASTEVETLAVAFNAMLARLEDSFRRLAAFSSDIAHELRTPVSNLMLQTQVLLADARTVEQYQDVLYSNLEEYERMAQMIGDMLFLAQADNGLFKPGTATVDLAAEVRALFDYFDAWAEERRVTLVIDGSATPVLGDRLMLRRALSNLLANAIRYTPVKHRVCVHLESDIKTTQIAVENPGTPIPPEHLPRIFDRFYRVDSSRQGEGAGLGLAITKSIVAAHDGIICVTSNEQGTRFLLTLPNAKT